MKPRLQIFLHLLVCQITSDNVGSYKHTALAHQIYFRLRMKNLEIIVSETEVQYILPTWPLEAGRLGRPGPPHFSRKLLKLDLQTLNIFNGTIGEKHAYRQYRFVPAQTSRSESKRELLRSENKQIVSAVATHSWRAMLRIRCWITKYSLIFVCRFFARFHGCTWNHRCQWTQLSMHVVVKWILLPCQD